MPASRNRTLSVTRLRLYLPSLWRTTTAIALIGAIVACAESTPVAPSPLPVAPPSTPAQSPLGVLPPFKEPTSSARIYKETGPLYAFAYSYHGGIVISRYVLYEDGTFALQFASPKYGLFEYKGKYERRDPEIFFLFNDANLAGPWDALGTVSGGDIRVVYNGIMIGADFENGVYRENPPAP